MIIFTFTTANSTKTWKNKCTFTWILCQIVVVNLPYTSKTINSSSNPRECWVWTRAEIMTVFSEKTIIFWSLNFHGPAPFTTPVPQPGHPNDVAFGGSESVVGSPRARAAAVFMASTHLRNNGNLALSTSSKTTYNSLREPENGNGT